MRAAFAVLAAAMPAAGGRRIAVLGDMLELGDAAGRLHRELAGPLDAASVDRSSSPLGSEMRGARRRAARRHAAAAMRRYCRSAIATALVDFLHPGDVVMVKGSLRQCALATSSSGLLAAIGAARGLDAMLYPLLYPARRSFPAFQPVPLPHLPHGRARSSPRCDQLRLRPADHRLAAAPSSAKASRSAPTARQAICRAKRARRRWAAFLILLALTMLDPALGRSHQPLCLDRAAGHGRLRADRLLRRLPKADQQLASRAVRPDQVVARDRDRRRRLRRSRRESTTGMPLADTAWPCRSSRTC